MFLNRFKKKNDNMIVTSKTSIDDLLPIGSVVNILDFEHRLMIVGIKQINLDDNHEYDYIGVPYPEGQIGIESQVLFNNQDVTNVSFIGCQDSERFAFLEQIRNL